MARTTSLLGALIALLTWPIASAIPRVGPDGSWVAGLYMALSEGLQFGTEFVFTYGPLGFLEQPALYGGNLWIVALLYRTAIGVALAIALLWAARRSLPLPIAAIVVYALLALGRLEAAAVLLIFLVCVAAIWEEPPKGAPILLALGGGALGAVELLGKLNYGISIVALCLIALLALPGRTRYLSTFAATLGGSFVLLWLAAGQSLAHLPAFFSNSLEVLSGYSEAMSTNVSDVGWQRPWAAVAVVLLAVAAALGSRGQPRNRQLPLIALTLVFGFLMFKQSFVRQGLGNATDFFPLMLGAAIGISWTLLGKVPRLPPRAPVVALLGPLAALTIVAFPGVSLVRALGPSDHVEFLRQDLRALASGNERRVMAEEGARSMKAYYRLDPASLRALRGRSVDIEPWEIGAAWAYGLNWQPLPVIQGYQAYTTRLDALNANALADTARPTALLRQNTAAFGDAVDPSIDDRNPSWDPPMAARAMLCNYRPVHSTLRWQILYPAPDRCGPEQLIRRVQTETDRPIAVPRASPGSIVFARIYGLEVTGPEQIRTFLYRARQRTATVDRSRTWRLVPGTAADGLILNAAKVDDFAPPFALAPHAHSLTLSLAGDSGRPIEIAFYKQRVCASGSFRRC